MGPTLLPTAGAGKPAFQWHCPGLLPANDLAGAYQPNGDKPEFEIAPRPRSGDVAPLWQVSSATSVLRPPFNPAARPLPRDQRLNRKNNTTMSDPVTSGTAAPAAPAETASATPSVGAQGATQPFGSFGATRGSGLLRGKAKRPAAPAAASTAPGGYQPSSIEVITSKSEYKNPFTGETSVASPAKPEPVERVVNEPAVPVAPQAVAAPVQIARPVIASPAPARAPSPELFPLDQPESAEKSELNILPPAETRRPAQSWESNGQGRTDERPTFRPEPRQNRRPDPRESNNPRAPREPSADARPAQPRAEREHREPRREEPKKSGGFIGWLKGLFGGGDKPATNGTVSTDESRRDGEYRHGRRHHRGGRGRQQNLNGPRDNQSAEGGRPQGGESHQPGEDGGHRRRRRGGRNRHRGDRGDRGGQPRPDGQQGGGAI